jgi:cleavage and polyadenylation specificity factor subunit 2
LQFEDNEVGFVTGRVAASASSVIPTLELITTGSSAPTPTERDPDPSVEDAPPAANVPAKPVRKLLGALPASKLPNSTLIGELKLTVLKARLASIGVQAELVGEGVLICGSGSGSGPGGSSGVVPLEEMVDVVAVRKVARGRVVLEGSASEMYYTVRREVYNLYALVSAA